MENFKIGAEVIRTKGDFKGFKGTVLEIDETRNRCRVDWKNQGIFWLSINSMKLA